MSTAKGKKRKQGIRCPKPHPDREGPCDELLLELDEESGVLGRRCLRGGHFRPLDVLQREAERMGWIAQEEKRVQQKEEPVKRSLLSRLFRRTPKENPFEQGPWVTAFVKWEPQIHDEATQRYLQEFPEAPGMDLVRRPKNWLEGLALAKSDAAILKANLTRRAHFERGGTHGRFARIVEEILPTLPCVRFSGGNPVGYDSMFPSASFSALVTDAKEFEAAAQYIIDVANQRMPGVKIGIDWIQVRNRF